MSLPQCYLCVFHEQRALRSAPRVKSVSSTEVFSTLALSGMRIRQKMLRHWQPWRAARPGMVRRHFRNHSSTGGCPKTTLIDSISCPQGDPMPESARQCPILKNSLSEKQLAAIELLVAGRSLGGIAKAIEVDPKTVYRWRKSDEFLEVLNAR